MDRRDSAHDIWMTLASMHREEELQLIRQEIQYGYGNHTDHMQTTISTSSSINHDNQIQEVDHGTMTYTLNGYFYTPPNEPVIIPDYHPSSVHELEKLLMKNLVKTRKNRSQDYS
jgi:hypothetical protein